MIPQQRPRAAPLGAIMDLISIVLIAFAAWITMLVVAVAICRAASNADADSERAEARWPNALLTS
jgi:multisubunit Na+/H+ antiporter MnhG subunit